MTLGELLQMLCLSLEDLAECEVGKVHPKHGALVQARINGEEFGGRTVEIEIMVRG